MPDPTGWQIVALSLGGSALVAITSLATVRIQGHFEHDRAAAEASRLAAASKEEAERRWAEGKLTRLRAEYALVQGLAVASDCSA